MKAQQTLSSIDSFQGNFLEYSTSVLDTYFLSAMLIVLMYNLLLLIFTKNSLYLYLITLVLTLTFHQSSCENILTFLLPSSFSLNHLFEIIPLSYLSLFLVLFLSFIRRKKKKSLDTFIKIFVFSLVLVLLFNDNQQYSFDLFIYFSLLISIFFDFTSCYYSLIKEEKYSKYIVGIWFVTIVGTILFMLFSSDVLILPSFELFEATIVIEVLLFILILTGLVNGLKNEKDLLSQELLEKQHEEKLKDKIINEHSKLAALGELLQNISHQWRQPLTELNAIALNIETDFHQNKLDKEQLDFRLSQLEETTFYMSQTIEDFNGYYKDDLEQKDTTLEEVVLKALKLQDSSFKAHNVQVTVCSEENIEFNKDSGKLIQVLIAIMTNAKDALVENNIQNKMIKVLVKKENNIPSLYIEDNAKGIKEEVINKIFEPYFTTKFKSQGIGIGLYMSKKIIEEELNGQLSVENINYGARFKIEL